MCRDCVCYENFLIKSYTYLKQNIFKKNTKEGVPVVVQ